MLRGWYGTIGEFPPYLSSRHEANGFIRRHKDPYANGAWEWLQPGMATSYLDALRERQANLLFASADWALGWRGFIDGAIEDGTRAAMEILTETRGKQTQKAKL